MLEAIILGSIQGITEFLPISSSGHLLLSHELLGYTVPHELSFDVALHVGTLIALLMYFWQDVRTLLRAVFALHTTDERHASYKRLAWYLVVAAIPAALAGAFFESFFESLRTVPVVIATLVIVGALFLITERIRIGQHDIDHMTWKRALAVGFAQVLALIPGVSRSGITIVAGMFAGLNRAEAARFTFLLSIPTIAGAGLKKFLDLRTVQPTSPEIIAMVVGIVSAALVGYAVIHFLMRFLRTHRLDGFAYYRLALALVAALLLIVR